MNETDFATQIEERHRLESIARARAAVPILKPTGKCLWCGKPIPAEATNQRFCDKEHRDEYDYYMARHPELSRKR